jgi:hypothetical protein
MGIEQRRGEFYLHDRFAHRTAQRFHFACVKAVAEAIAIAERRAALAAQGWRTRGPS